MSVLGDNLRKARENAGLSQEAVAKILGMSRENYVKVETKGKAGPKLLNKIARIEELGLTIEELKAWKAVDDLGPVALAIACKTFKEGFKIVDQKRPKK